MTGDDRNGALPDGQRAIAEREFQSLRELEASDGDETPEQLLADLGDLLWEHAGILRTDESVSAGLGSSETSRADGELHATATEPACRSNSLSTSRSASRWPMRCYRLRASAMSPAATLPHRCADVDPDWRRNILVTG